MLKVTVHLKSGVPVIVECEQPNDVVFESEQICIYLEFTKWVFMKNEIEYIKMERRPKQCQ